MTKEILLILACVPLYVVNSFCDKTVSSKNQNQYNIPYNSIKFLLCAISMIPILLWRRESMLSFGSLLCGIFCGMMYAVSKTMMLKGYEKTSIAFMTLCHSSGMILPCVLGHFFWAEKLSLISIIGILLAIVSIVLLKGGTGERQSFDACGVLLGIVIFLTSAGVMISQKLMGLYYSDQSVGVYNFYSFIVAFLILVCFAKPCQWSAGKRAHKTTIVLCALGSAISLSVISFVMTNLAKAVPSVILFPLFNGLGIIFVCIGSIFAFGETLTKKKTAGLLIGIFGLCLVNL